MSINKNIYYILSKTKRFKVYKNLTILVCMLYSNHSHALKDSTRWDFKLKGIDIKIGKAKIDQTLNQKSNIFIQSTP